MPIFTSTKVWALGLALMATFLWSASKVILKLGLLELPPYTLMAAINVVAALATWLYYFWKRPALNFYYADKRGHLLALIAVIGYVVAPIFSLIGLQYISVGTAGLFATASSMLVVLFSTILLHEKPSWSYIAGLTVLIIGTYLFLATKFFEGSSFGIIMTALAEMAFALSIVLTRFVMAGVDNPSVLTALIGNTMAAVILVPIAFAADWRTASFDPRAIAVILVVGTIFAFSGTLWNNALNYLKAYEASTLQATMAVQAGLMSVLLLDEVINTQAWVGIGLVVIGAVISDLPTLWGLTKSHEPKTFQHI